MSERRAFLGQLAALATALRLGPAAGDELAAPEGPTLVVGATGRLGSLIVRRLTADGHPVRALVRAGRDAPTDLPASVQVAFGDVRDAASLGGALAGCERCVFAATASAGGSGENTPESVDYGGVVNVVAAASPALRRFLLISSSAVTQPLHPHNMWRDILTWKLKGEEHLRHSGLPYTIVRPTGMRNYAGGSEGIGFAQGDRFAFGYVISREDAATVCATAVVAPQAIARTFECYNSPEMPTGAIAERIAALVPDAS